MPPLIGDYCISGTFSPKQCEAGFCDGYSNFDDDGFCSAGCGSGCGNNSAGNPNICVGLTDGSSPGSVCKPTCKTDVDCQKIHPDLLCWTKGALTACDYDTSSWR